MAHPDDESATALAAAQRVEGEATAETDPGLKLVDTLPMAMSMSSYLDSDHQYSPKTYNINNGIVEFRTENGQMKAGTSDYAKYLDDEGYTRDGSKSVELGNGMNPREDDVTPVLEINRMAVMRGVKQRELTYTDKKTGEEIAYVEPSPFDQGEYIHLSRSTTEYMGGDGEKPVYHQDLARDVIKDPQYGPNVGMYNVNNGVMTWVTAGGEVQAAPVTDEKLARLEQMGYAQNADMAVAHSNGETWQREGRVPMHLHQVMNEKGDYIGTVDDIWRKLEAERDGEAKAA